MIGPAPLRLGPDGDLVGGDVARSRRCIGDLRGVFADDVAWSALDPGTLAYEVASYCPVPEGTEGGLFFGFTRIMPGFVGDEYFMTKGHFHDHRDRSEYYWCTEGEGWLVLMNEDGQSRIERLSRGGVSYIPARTAHRMVNVGTAPLGFGACWPADSGHDYETISQNGFGVRICERGGAPTAVDERAE